MASRQGCLNGVTVHFVLSNKPSTKALGTEIASELAHFERQFRAQLSKLSFWQIGIFMQNTH